MDKDSFFEPQQDVAGNDLKSPQNIHDLNDIVPLAGIVLPWRAFNVPFYLLGGHITIATDTYPPGFFASHSYGNHYGDIQRAAALTR